MAVHRTFWLVLLFSLAASPLLALTPSEIDRYFAAHWKSHGIEPAPLVDDAGFLRRVWLDVAGVIPPAGKVLAFESSRRKNKRERVIDQLLGEPLFARFWAERLSELLLVAPDFARDRDFTRGFRQWLERVLAQGMAYDVLVERLISARGALRTNPEILYVSQHYEDEAALTGHVASTFLGAQIQCAQCHDHPFQKWTQRDFRGIQAVFARLEVHEFPREIFDLIRRRKLRSAYERYLIHDPSSSPGEVRRLILHLAGLLDVLPPPSVEVPAGPARPEMTMKGGEQGDEGGGDEDETDDVFLVLDSDQGELTFERKREEEESEGEADTAADETASEGEVQESWNRSWPVRPRYLDGTLPPWPDGGQFRREAFAKWMRADRSRLLAKALANRVWFWLFGRGLVSPVDDVVSPRDSTHADLLDRLAEHVVETRYDLRNLLGLIMKSGVYQRSLGTSEATSSEAGHFASCKPRPLRPPQLFDSLVEATGLREVIEEDGGVPFAAAREDYLHDFEEIFENDGTAPRDDSPGTLDQALFLLNSEELADAVAPGTGDTLESVYASDEDPRVGIFYLYRTALARQPTAAELERALAFLDQAGEGSDDHEWLEDDPRERAWSDLFWALLTSTEFLTNH